MAPANGGCWFMAKSLLYGFMPEFKIAEGWSYRLCVVPPPPHTHTYIHTFKHNLFQTHSFYTVYKVWYHIYHENLLSHLHSRPGKLIVMTWMVRFQFKVWCEWFIKTSSERRILARWMCDRERFCCCCVPLTVCRLRHLRRMTLAFWTNISYICVIFTIKAQCWNMLLRPWNTFST